MTKTILVVEDEKKISELICKYLLLEQFTTRCAINGREAVSLFSSVQPDLVLLDIMLPDMDGISVCDHIRAESDVPIIMLSARVDEVDRLIGFAKGADDYVCKPFLPRELVARVHVLLRRAHRHEAHNSRQYGPITVDETSHSVAMGSRELHLTKIEFSMLNALMAYPHKVFSREELLSAIQGRYTSGYERTVDTHIKNLRKKLGKNASGGSYIQSVYGIGYKLN